MDKIKGINAGRVLADDRDADKLAPGLCVYLGLIGSVALFAGAAEWNGVYVLGLICSRITVVLFVLWGFADMRSGNVPISLLPTGM